MSTPTETTTPTTTTDALVNVLLPAGYARVLVELPMDVRDGWFRKIGEHWHELREGKAEPGFEGFLTRHVGHPCFLSPVGWRYPWTTELSSVLPVSAL